MNWSNQVSVVLIEKKYADKNKLKCGVCILELESLSLSHLSRRTSFTEDAVIGAIYKIWNVSSSTKYA